MAVVSWDYENNLNVQCAYALHVVFPYLQCQLSRIIFFSFITMQIVDVRSILIHNLDFRLLFL